MISPHALRATLRRSLDLVWPPIALDGGGRPASPGLSAPAWSRINFIDGPVCDGCGAPFDYDMGEGVRCAACQARRPAFDRARAACVYDEHSRDLILQLKHADRTDLAGLFARGCRARPPTSWPSATRWRPCRCTRSAYASAATTRPPRSPVRWPAPPAGGFCRTRWCGVA